MKSKSKIKRIRIKVSCVMDDERVFTVNSDVSPSILTNDTHLSYIIDEIKSLITKQNV